MEHQDLLFFVLVVALFPVRLSEGFISYVQIKWTRSRRRQTSRRINIRRKIISRTRN